MITAVACIRKMGSVRARRLDAEVAAGATWPVGPSGRAKHLTPRLNSLAPFDRAPRIAGHELLPGRGGRELNRSASGVVLFSRTSAVPHFRCWKTWRWRRAHG